MDSFIFLLIGLYLDNVLPDIDGIRRPWNYFLTRTYWHPHAAANNPNLLEESDEKLEAMVTDGEDGAFFEKASHDLKAQKDIDASFNIKKMTKRFDDGKVAVKDFTLEIYRGQVFILLGHNGAGKTTALSMLTGLLQPTSGQAFIQGIDVFRENSRLKRILGICPQESIIYDVLTIEEHLSIFCSLKNLDYNIESQNLMVIMMNLGISRCLTRQAKDLSGGEKRKLSILLALIGNPTVIMLDEPTSGLDVDSRRKIWETVRKIKQDKIILMTTHYMDEAEELGDRIGIMTNGEIKCCGSGLFLKRVFRTGYSLTMVKTSTFNQGRANDLVSKYIRDYKINQETMSEVIYNIPFEASNTFPRMFEELDQSLSNIGISSYGFAITSLEDVFLKVGEDHSKDKNTNDESSEFSISRNARQSLSKKLFAVILKVWLQAIRNPRILIFEMFLPLILFGLAFLSSLIDISKVYTYDLNAVSKKLPIVINSELAPSSILEKLKKELPFEHWYMKMSSESDPNKRAREFYEKANNTYWNKDYFGGIYVDKIDDNGILAMVMGDPRWPHIPTYLCSILTNAFLRINYPKVTITPRIATMEVYDELGNMIYDMFNMIALAALTGIAFSVPIASIAYFLVKERKALQKFMELFHGLSIPEYWIGRFIADHVKLLFPFAIIVILKAISDINVSFYNEL